MSADKKRQCMHYNQRTESGRGIASSRCPEEATYRTSGERKEIYCEDHALWGQDIRVIDADAACVGRLTSNSVLLKFILMGKAIPERLLRSATTDRDSVMHLAELWKKACAAD